MPNSKQSGSKSDTDHKKNDSNQLNRRNFIQLGAVGLAPLAISPAISKELLSEDESDHKKGSSSRADTVIIENWNEPWEWVVGDYGPDDYLQLNVVENQSSSVTGTPGGAPLFSYNGMVPGPTIRARGDETIRVHLNNNLSGNNGNYAYKSGTRNVMTNEVVPNQPDWKMKHHAYGPHQQHTTNLHTHGLHVSPKRNPDGSWSDNVLLRIVPQQDFLNRKKSGINWPLLDNEIRKETKYEFRLGEIGPIHPPGTHWYHPHPHGATFDQVASGMAGFLIVEGDVDDALKEQIKGYKERLIFVQRVIVPPPVESETPKRAGSQQVQSFATVNGSSGDDNVIVMKPGAIERWRVLNGSVDGQGYIEFQVTRDDPGTPPTVPAMNASSKSKSKFFSALASHNKKQDDNVIMLDQLAFDGITLVIDGKYDTQRVESLNMAPANRADFLFEAPKLKSGETSATYTIWGNWIGDVTDRQSIPSPVNIKIATVKVTGNAVDPGVKRNSSTGKLNIKFPKVPNILAPVADKELLIDNGLNQGKWRARKIEYAGWGHASTPVKGITGADRKFVNAMIIDGKKFGADTPEGQGFDRPQHKMAVNTAEEWTVFNYSMTIYSDNNNDNTNPVYGKAFPKNDSSLKAISKAADHPFHMHQNPFWVTSIKDSTGKELLPNGIPRWQDVVQVPRNGGRVIFRSRFWDYVGEFVNHCHLLQHEDWGMMQAVSIVSLEENANYDAIDPNYAYPCPTIKEMYDINFEMNKAAYEANKATNPLLVPMPTSSEQPKSCD